MYIFLQKYTNIVLNKIFDVEILNKCNFKQRNFKCLCNGKLNIQGVTTLYLFVLASGHIKHRTVNGK